MATPRLSLAAAASLCCALLANSSPAAGAASLPTLSISISPGSIAVTGTRSSGAVEVVTGAARDMREPATVLVLLKPGAGAGELVSFLAAGGARDANAISRYGEIVFDVPARAGSSTEAQTALAPGTYVALDAEGEKSAAWSHASFTVTLAAAPAALPVPRAVERTIDFAFEGPRTLHRGQLVRFEDEGFLAHMDAAVPARSRQSAERLARDLQAGREKAAERLIAGRPVTFAGPLSTGSLQQERITAAPGWYVQVCVMDAQDGRPQTLLGMERVIRIVS